MTTPVAVRITEPIRRQRKIRWRMNAFSILELFAAVGIVAILIALIFPTAKSYISVARMSGCTSNLRQIGGAGLKYMADNNGAWPPNSSGVPFCFEIQPYLAEKLPTRLNGNFRNSPFVCPSDRYGGPDGSFHYQKVYVPGGSKGYGVSYAQNAFLHNKLESTSVGSNPAAVENLSKLAFYMDFEETYLGQPAVLLKASTDPAFRCLDLLEMRHHGKLNVFFADGSLRQVPLGKVSQNGDYPRQFWQGRGVEEY